MADRTLLAEDLNSSGEKLLCPFASASVQPASYDIRVGSTVMVAYPEGEGGIRALSLDSAEGQDSTEIPPGHAAIVRSLEQLSLPTNMKGRLSLRGYYSTKLLAYPGGSIDPGYRGYLFLAVVNLGDGAIRLRYGDPIVTAEFVQLDRDTDAYHEGQVHLQLPKDRQPPLPSRRTYDTVELSTKIDGLATKIDDLATVLERVTPQVESTQQIVHFVLLAAVGGVLAGSILAAVTTQSDLLRWTVAAGAAVTVAILGVVWAVGHLRRRA
ncbi:MAG: hypothetical protein HQ548_04275 [Chloroflexi bacterium]|nr:hypothetical protein [Chloroflexota bacterium]